MYNPYLPSNEFVPDGEPRVFGDRIYLYGSHDEYGEKSLCTGDYVCWSAPLTMEEWRYEGVIYERMQDPYIRKITEKRKGNMFNQYLYAPDVIEIEGKYYLYYGVAMSGAGFGVAVADAPTGPFTYLGRVRYPQEAKPKGWKDTEDGIDDGDMALGMGMPMIQLNPFKKHFGLNMKDYAYDPAVLYDEGRLFLYFGCGYCYAAELSTEDMRTLVKSPETGTYITGPLLPSTEKADRQAVAAQDGWHMGNGSSIRRINGKYYLSYYAANKDKGNAMCYSMSDSPFGPFTYQGVLVSLGNGRYKDQLLPTAYVGNTHGGMVQINGTWYQNYHRQTGDEFPARQACMTELVMREDGTFEQAEYKSQIREQGGMPWKGEYPAYIACELLNREGITGTRKNTPYFVLDKELDMQVVTGLYEGSCVGIKYIDFGEPTQQKTQEKIQTNEYAAKPGNELRATIETNGKPGGEALICLDDPKQVIGKVKLEQSGRNEAVIGQKPEGVHEVFVRFTGVDPKAEFVKIYFC